MGIAQAFLCLLLVGLAGTRNVDNSLGCPSLRQLGSSDGPESCPQVCATDQDCTEQRKCLCSKECGFVCLDANITCGTPTAPANGFIHMTSDGRSVGSVIEMRCDEGYFRRGYPYIAICSGNGTWTRTTASCIGRSCGDPGSPNHGKRIGMLFNYGDIVTFTCMRGYRLKGVTSRTCQSNVTWTGTQPACEPVECVSPQRVPNAYVKSYGGFHVYGSIVMFNCKSGYRLEGMKSMFCGSNGKWRGRPPVCTKTLCPIPDDIPNGQRQGSNTSVGATVHYKCNAGYKLYGSHWRRCSAEGDWSGVKPVCFECARVGTGVLVRNDISYKNGTVKSKIGHVVTVHYPISDEEEEVITLGIGTRHYIIVEDRVPSEKEIFIGTRVLAENPRTLRYMFATVRVVNGSKYMVDFDDKSRGEMPLLKIRTLEPPRFCAMCSDPGRPQHSSREDDLSEFITGMEVIYTCQFTYKMIGPERRTCQSNGQWTGTDTICKVHSCDELDALPPWNGARQGESFTIGSSLSFTCNEGHVLEGPSKLKCRASGTWSDNPPSCRGVCERFSCPMVGQKCVFTPSVGPLCTCRRNEDCSSLYNPVCGSDGKGYNNECIMSATGCREGRVVHKVKDGRCLPAGLCQILPHSVCRGFFIRFYFNPQTQKCQNLIAGGCHPSGWNGFFSERECNQTCLGDICSQQADRGPCSLNMTRWVYDTITRRCKKFEYGGCYGNENNFASLDLCQQRCSVSENACPSCKRMKLRPSCINSTLAFVANVTSELPVNQQRSLLRYVVEIKHVFKNQLRGSLSTGRTVISVPYQQSSQCPCPRLPLKKYFIVIGGFSTDSPPRDPKSGLILDSSMYVHGWSASLRRQIEKRCSGYLSLPDDM